MTGRRKSAARKPAASPAALGFRSHTGWAVMVAMTGPPSSPRVAYRCRIELGGPGVPRFVYHAAQEAGLAKAPRIVRLAQTTAGRAATQAMREAIAKLEADGLMVVAGGVLTGSMRVPKALDAILASHPLLHAAEGELFREALVTGCKAGGIRLRDVPERELWTRAEQRLGLKRAVLQRRLVEFGGAAGRPWAQDQKLAALTAWLALKDR
jgi:hypothetical protein